MISQTAVGAGFRCETFPAESDDYNGESYTETNTRGNQRAAPPHWAAVASNVLGSHTNAHRVT
jgi:hypothetical protein